MKTTRTLLFAMAIILFSCFAAQGGEPSNRGKNTDVVIEYLLDQIARSNLTFIRNGAEYSGREAAIHIRDKYAYLKSQVKSPEDFIHVCASQSLLSGEYYMISTEHGQITVEKWLEQKLKGDRQ